MLSKTLKGLAFVGTLLLVLAQADAAPVRRNLLVNFDGTYDEAYPDGSKPMASDNWTSLSLGDDTLCAHVDDSAGAGTAFTVTGDGSADEIGGTSLGIDGCFLYRTISSPTLQFIANNLGFNGLEYTENWSFSGSRVMAALTDVAASATIEIPFGGAGGTPEYWIKSRAAASGVITVAGFEDESPGCEAITVDINEPFDNVNLFTSQDVACAGTWTHRGAATVALSQPFYAGLYVVSQELLSGSEVSWDTVSVSPTITITPPSSPPPIGANTFPQLLSISIGGSIDWCSSAARDLRSKFDVLLIGQWAEYTCGGAMDLEGIVSDIRTRATANGNSGIEIAKYWLVSEWPQTPGGVNAVVTAKLAAESAPLGRDWYAYTGNGAKVISAFPGLYMLNVTNAVTVDSNGDYLPEFVAEWVYSTFIVGDGFDTVFWDLFNPHPYSSVAADYDNNGSNDSVLSATVTQKWREGYMRGVNRLNALNSSVGQWGNAFGNSGVAITDVRYGLLNPTSSPEYYQQVYGMQESLMGKSYSWWTFNGFPGTMKQCQTVISNSKDGRGVCTYFVDTATSYHQARFALTLCMLTDAYCAINPNQGGYNVQPFFEEFDNAGAGLGYCGEALDDAEDFTGSSPPAAWSNGVYKRAYENCLILSFPSKTGSAMVTLPDSDAAPWANEGTHFETIDGTDANDPGYYDGLTKTTFTLTAGSSNNGGVGDGVVLVRVAD
jgi:hypothetical protein